MGSLSRKNCAKAVYQQYTTTMACRKSRAQEPCAAVGYVPEPLESHCAEDVLAVQFGQAAVRAGRKAAAAPTPALQAPLAAGARPHGWLCPSGEP